MSATTLGHKGMEAINKRDWAGALALLDKALEDSGSPAWLLGRATANYQLKNYDAALQDAELAYHNAAMRGSGDSRRHMIQAQYRRATVYFKLGRYADSDCCTKWSMLLAEGRPAREDDGVEKNIDEQGHYTVTYEEGLADKEGQPGKRSKTESLTSIMSMASSTKTGFEQEWNRAYAWRSQVLGAMKNLPADHPGRTVNVNKIPPKPEAKKVQKSAPVAAADTNKPTGKPTSLAAADSEKHLEKPAPVPGSVPDEKMKLRVDFYQTNQTVTIALFTKDAKKEELKVEIMDNQVRVSPIPREAAPYVKPGDRESTSTLVLAERIVPSESRWSATPRKIELVLRKATPGVKWATWGEEKIGTVDVGGSTSTSSPKSQPATAPATVATVAASTSASAPAYPTSSKKGPMNWEKLGEAEAGNEERDDINYFFKSLYKGATPDQQRAMMKSFIESNGTSLSTDWNDVGSRKVETVPPDGVEAKKWES